MAHRDSDVSMTSERVAVIGAGPAGSVTAFRLAEAGVPVDLIDPAPFPREKACGDLLGTGTVDALVDLGLGGALDGGYRIDGEWFFDASDRCVRRTDVGTSASPVALPRLDLDAALRDAAGDAGATLIRAKCTDIGAPASPGRTLGFVDATGRAFDRSYRFVVGADGARSTTARRAGLHPGLAADHAVTIRRYVSTEEDLSRQLWFFLPDDETASTAGPAYCWAFPVAERRLNIGIYACAPAAGRNLSSRLDRFHRRLVAKLGAGAVLADPSPVRGGIVRYDFDPARVAADGIALVGDAAGLGHAIIGEGILYAVTSGALVADAVVEGGAEGTVEATIAAAFDAAFTSIVSAARTAAHDGRSIIGGQGATFGPEPEQPDAAAGQKRSDLLQRVVDQAASTDHGAEDRPTARDDAEVHRWWLEPGRDIVQIPADRAVRFELVGGGGAGGHWQGGSGGTAPRLSGTIPPRDTAWELHVWCGQGGGVDPAMPDDVPSLGGPGGHGFTAGGAGGWGSGNGAGGAGGGGGASALRSDDDAVLIVAPGGGGGGGGGGPVDRVGGDGNRGDESPRGWVSVTVEPGGTGDYGVTRGGLRGGGGGGGGGGCPGGAGGGGGGGGDGGSGGGEGTAATIGADPDALRIGATNPEATTDDPGTGGRGGARTPGAADDTAGTVGAPGRNGLVALWW